MTVKTLSSSIKISENLDKQLSLQVIKDGYGMRGKNKWIKAAIEEFLSLDDFVDMVDLASDMDGLNKAVSLRLEETLMAKIDAAILKVRKVNPMMEGVQSHLIRASILQKIIRSPNQ